MTPKDAFGVVDGAIARATNLPVSYVVVSEALNSLQGALEKLDEFERVQKRNGREREAVSEKITADDTNTKGEGICG